MNNQDSPRYALLSVFDKSGVVDIATALERAGYRLLSTGGTAQLLRDQGLTVLDVSDHTGSEEMMAGRVKTLHPTIHGGILGRRGTDDAVMDARGIAAIDFVVTNLYPFAATTEKEGVTFDEVIENIDIGGPAMVRSAAKNHAAVTVITDPADYPRVANELSELGETSAALRFELAVKAFQHTAQYDGTIASFLGRVDTPGSLESMARFPKTFNSQYVLAQELRYGENPHQAAALYHDARPASGSLAASNLIQGKALSYNNVMDADAALACVRQFVEPACVIVKHANPCGVSVAADITTAYQRAFETDKTSAFGGIIAFNQSLDLATASGITSQQFVEVIIAPGISDDAAEHMKEFPNVRVLDCGTLPSVLNTLQLKPISGGMLVQDDDLHELDRNDIEVVSSREPDENEIRDLLFAWNVAKFVKSNAIVYCKDQTTIGVGAGQMSRVYSAKIAAIKAQDSGLTVSGSVMASDAFFPFRDGIDQANEVGIAAVIQPGGSRNDEEVIAAANEHNMAMVFTGVRHFRH